ncbi:MAG: SPOR domain-containing protein [Fibrobacter sp.]|nr:SPOR domain-containing protein [Fibrobacter sp.]
MKTKLAVLLSTMMAVCAGAQTAKTMADAQKAYVSGNWKEAAAAYAAVCPKEPQDKQAECWLWNVLALSQTGEAKSFKEAGKRLDSLIQVVNPQQSLYSDLLMTSAQFRLYLGKYDKAAEHLIQAIETAHPHQYVVLQKVCQAVKTKFHSDDLAERCESLKNPPVEQPKAAEATTAPAQPAQPATAPAQEAQPVVTSSSSAAALVAQAEQPKTEPAKVEQKTEPAKAASSSSAAATSAAVAPASSAAPAPAVQPAQPAVAPAQTAASSAPAQPAQQAAPATAAQPAAAAAQEYWVLQLGAFGVKDNATLLVSTLKKRKIQANIVEQLRGERTLYLVQTGHFATKDEAVDYGAKQLAPLKVEFQPLFKK